MTASLNKLAALQNLPAVATNTTAPSSDPPSFIQVALYMILLLSTFIFALCTYFKLNKEAQLQGAAGGTQPQGAAGGTGISIPNRWGIALGSVFCAIAAGFLSYLVYTYGGT